jgi:anthranilate phosphoribosyltransferase
VLLHPRDHGIQAPEVAFEGLEAWREQALAALAGEGALADALRWNLGAMLWFSGACDGLPDCLTQAEALLRARSGLRQLQELVE